MKKVFLYVFFGISLFSCKTMLIPTDKVSQKQAINKLLNQWHRDVAQFRFDAYFDKMTEDAIFIGTDASEVWSKEEFQVFSKPYFEQHKTWDFKPLHRNIYSSKNSDIAWFDELLDTWMGVTRGSGVVVYQNKQWKIQHYVLSVVVPNELMPEIRTLKKEKDSIIISTFKN